MFTRKSLLRAFTLHCMFESGVDSFSARPVMKCDDEYYNEELMRGFRAAYVKEQTEVHQLKVELEKLENQHYEALRHIKQQKMGIMLSLQGQKESYAETMRLSELESVQSQVRYERMKEQTKLERQNRLDKLKAAKEEVDKEILAIQKQIEMEAERHEIRKTKLTDAIDDINYEINTMKSNLRDTREKLRPIQNECGRLEKKRASLHSANKTSGTRLKTVRSEYGKMKADLDALNSYK